MDRRIISICRGDSYYKTKVILDNGEIITLDDNIEKVVDEYLRCYGTSLSISKMICNEIFNFKRILPIIVSTMHDMYLCVNMKLSDESIVLFDLDKVIDYSYDGEFINLFFRNFSLKILCSKSTFELQCKRIEEMRKYYDKGNKFTTEFIKDLKEGNNYYE